MPTATVSMTVSVGGESVSTSYSITEEGLVKDTVTCPAAQSGTLGTRTSDTAGTATLAADHAITTGMMVDITWTGGFARGATVGTVNGTSVPFTGATGDAMPVATTAIKLCPVVSMPVNFDPDVAAVENFHLAGGGQVAFRTSGAEAYAFELDDAGMYHWDNTQVASNPLGSTAITEVRASTTASTAKLFKLNILSSVQ